MTATTTGEPGPGANPYDTAPNPGAVAATLDVPRNRVQTHIWLIRILGGVTAVLTVVTGMLTVVIMEMMPLKQVVPYLVTIGPTKEGIATITPAPGDYRRLTVVVKSFLAQYVDERETVIPNHDWQMHKWRSNDSFIRQVSTPKVWAEFESHSNDVLANLDRREFTTEVAVTDVRLIEPTKHLWEVDYDTRQRFRRGLSDGDGRALGSDPNDPTGLRVIHWTARIQLEPLPLASATPRTLLLNPLQLLVASYVPRDIVQRR